MKISDLSASAKGAVALALAVLALASPADAHGRQTVPETSPTPAASPVAAQKTAEDANEMGRIPIVMYHSVGEAMSPKMAALSEKMGLNVSAATFRKQLEMMWKAGWYPVNMRDVLTTRIDIPRGKTPVVLTFDDARKSQFHYLKDGSIDPNCAVGLLLEFHRKHPQDWPLRASFYLLPESKYNPAPFGQKGLETKKLQFLQDQGFELANHSTTHHPMRNMSAKQLEWEMSECFRYVRARVPTASMDTMALPYGLAPKDKALWNVLLTNAPSGKEGEDAAVPGIYHNRCILLAGGNPSFAPGDRRFDIKQVMRVNVAPGELEGWIRSLKRSSGAHWRAYVSDGDPEVVTVPRSELKDLEKSRLDGARLVVYADAPDIPKKLKKKDSPKVARSTEKRGA